MFACRWRCSQVYVYVPHWLGVCCGLVTSRWASVHLRILRQCPQTVGHSQVCVRWPVDISPVSIARHLPTTFGKQSEFHNWFVATLKDVWSLDVSTVAVDTRDENKNSQFQVLLIFYNVLEYKSMDFKCFEFWQVQVLA